MDTFTSMAELVRTHARAMPDRLALGQDVAGSSVRLTWSQLDRLTNRVARTLLANGVTKGDRVAIVERNGIALLALMVGASKADAIPVPMNWRLAAGELGGVMRDADPRVAFVGTEFAGLVGAALADTGRPALVPIDDAVDPSAPDLGGTWLGSDDSDPAFPFDPDLPTVVLYTSGTTGAPKGAVLDHRSFAAQIPGNATTWRYDTESVNLMGLGGFHTGGTLWALTSMWVGAATVPLADSTPAGIVDTLRRWQITHIAVVPTLLAAMLDQPGVTADDFRSLRFLAYGASPIPSPLLVRAIRTIDCAFLHSYGLTETVGGVFELLPEEHTIENIGAPRLASVGRPAAWVEFRVVDDDGADVPSGTTGEVWIRSAQRMREYWRNPEATAQRITPDGWVRSGDLGYTDDDGFLYLRARKQDVIVSGGENVFPGEVEAVLARHPAVASCVVLGVPDDRWIEKVVAAVIPREEGSVSAAELDEFLRPHLPGYKCPRDVIFVPQLPVNGAGKVVLAQVRELFDGR